MGNIFVKKPSVGLLNEEENIFLEQITIDCIGDCNICKINGLEGYQINNLETGLLVFVCKKCYCV
jgi:hypothetical protein